MPEKHRNQRQTKHFEEMMTHLKTLPKPEGKVMSFEEIMVRIKTLWEDLHASISDLPEEKQTRIWAIVEELESLTIQAEEEART